MKDAATDAGDTVKVVGAQVSDSIVAAQESGSIIPSISPHRSIRCNCGCVPNILSMFEMAELRAASRKKKNQAEP